VPKTRKKQSANPARHKKHTIAINFAMFPLGADKTWEVGRGRYFSLDNMAEVIARLPLDIGLKPQEMPLTRRASGFFFLTL